MLFRQSLRSGQLIPDAIKDAQLCMDTYRSVSPKTPFTFPLIFQLSWMFDCCRVPGTQGHDWSVSYAGSPNPHDDLGHVIVIRKNRFWKIKAQVGDKVVGMGDLIRCGFSLEQRLQNAMQRHLLHSIVLVFPPVILMFSPQPIPTYI